LDATQNKAISLVNEKLDPFITESSKQFITGELSIENDWATYLQDIDDKGYKTLETIWNAAWEDQK
jgi:hypothetical protein